VKREGTDMGEGDVDRPPGTTNSRWRSGRLAAATAGARAAGGRLDGGALVIRCLAPSAPGLLGMLVRLWDATRRLVLGIPPLALRKA
jgi:hypothetical protein